MNIYCLIFPFLLRHMSYIISTFRLCHVDSNYLNYSLLFALMVKSNYHEVNAIGLKYYCIINNNFQNSALSYIYDPSF